MLGLFGKKSDNPMANIKSAQALLDEIPKNDALKALQELTTWVESVREQEGFRLDHQLAVLRLIDETAHPFERKLMREYFAANTPPPFQENRLWIALSVFFGQAAHAYFTVLTRYRNGDKGSSAIEPSLPLVAARGIRAVTGKLKCAAARYVPVEATIWGCLAEFYAHAEAQQYVDKQVALYSGSGASTSVCGEFAAVLMWYSSCASTLNRLHLHLSERLASHLSKSFTVGVQGEPNSLFSFDLLNFAPPVRVNAKTTLQPSLRFLGVNNLQTQIEALLKLLEKNIVPEEIDLGGAYDAGTVRDAARHLAECWAFPPPKRRSIRHNIKVNLSVANGFSKIMEHTDAGLNFSNDTSVTWDVENISTGGLHCVLPASNRDALSICSLIGIKPEKVDHWGVGIVRRMIRDQQNNLHVGVEVLANRMSSVGLREHSVGEEQPALWLGNPADDSGEAMLLMGHDTFSGSRSLHVTVSGKSYLLMPLGLVESGTDYDLARYRKVEEDTSPDGAY